MLRKLLGMVIALALPAVLAGQAPATPAPSKPMPAVSHGVATQVQGAVVGEVAGVEEIEGANNQEGLDEKDGDNNDVDDHDVDNEGVGESDGANNDVDVGEHVDQNGDEQGETDAPAPPPAAGQSLRIGRHKP